VNVRPALEQNAYTGGRLVSSNQHDDEEDSEEIPEISQEVELRMYCANTMQCLRVFKGHHAFTLKQCPFFCTVDVIHVSTLLGESAERVEGDDHQLIVSGSESGEVFVWSTVYSQQHRGQPVKVLSGHSKHAGGSSFNPKVPGMVASGSDDGTVIVRVGEYPRRRPAVTVTLETEMVAVADILAKEEARRLVQEAHNDDEEEEEGDNDHDHEEEEEEEDDDEEDDMNVEDV
jgi:WD40 repeat protein